MIKFSSLLHQIVIVLTQSSLKYILVTIKNLGQKIFELALRTGLAELHRNSRQPLLFNFFLKAIMRFWMGLIDN